MLTIYLVSTWQREKTEHTLQDCSVDAAVVVAVPPTGGHGIGHGTAVVYQKSHTVVWVAASVRELTAAWLLLPVLFFFHRAVL